MKIPVSWIKEFVNLDDIAIDELARRITRAGLEVEAIHYVGLPMPADDQPREAKISGLSWPAEYFVVAEIREVKPHPNADRLTLCVLDDGTELRDVLTGAPNLFEYKGKGPLEKTLKVAYARLGARLYDGHQPGWQLTTLKKAKIRGVVSDSMVCSEKELGISEEHEGIIILDDDAPVGMPLTDYLGDAVLDIAITPNFARGASVWGVVREIGAILERPVSEPTLDVLMEGAAIDGQVAIEIREPEYNPRFVLGLIKNVTIQPSPYWMQRRLRLAGMRPINNIVDVTNYAMLEVGEPLHAFDYDVLVQRTGGKAPIIITRCAQAGEKLTTLDDVERTLDDFTVLVCDTAGALSIAGVMGGQESEVSAATKNVLLEGAAWNFINIRRTVTRQNLLSEAAYRFSRGVHPAMAERGVRRGLELMRLTSGGQVAQGLVDQYPLPQKDPQVEITPADVRRWLGISLSAEEMAAILRRLEFTVQVQGERVLATAPDHRLDIGEGVIGKADLMEEIARIYGYHRIPETRLADQLPPQRRNLRLEREEALRDFLVRLGLREIITYRMTSPEREARLLGETQLPYVRLVNQISSERTVMRHSLLPGLLEVVERNARVRSRQALFEVGPVYLPQQGELLPEEPARLVIALTGTRAALNWQPADSSLMDFYDLKGLVEAMLAGLHVEAVAFQPVEHPAFHPGKCAAVLVDGQQMGVMGELHPAMREKFDLPQAPVLAAEFNWEQLQQRVPDLYDVAPVPVYPPVLEDLAVVVDEALPAVEVEKVIRMAGGKLLAWVRLFDVYQGTQVGEGKKSLAYNLAYQAPDRTLTDKEAGKIRKKIIRSLEYHLKAQLRS